MAGIAAGFLGILAEGRLGAAQPALTDEDGDEATHYVNRPSSVLFTPGSLGEGPATRGILLSDAFSAQFAPGRDSVQPIQRDSTFLRSSPAKSLPSRQASTQRLFNRSRSMSRPSQRKLFFSQAADVRTEADLAAMDDLLYSALACKNMTRTARLALVRCASQQVFEPGDMLCFPAAPMDSVFFILQGEVEFTPADAPPGAELVLGPGASLGTFQLPSPQPKPKKLRVEPDAASQTLCWGGSAVALSDVEVAVVTQEQWAQVVASDPQWDARQVCVFLEELPVFGHLTRGQLLELSRLVRVKQVPAGNLVYKQATEGDHLYVVRRGFVRLLREMKAERQELERLNEMTYAVAGLSYQMFNLASPRAHVKGLPVLMPPTPRQDLGSAHASGAMTHRPRLQQACPPASRPAAECPAVSCLSPGPARTSGLATKKTARVQSPQVSYTDAAPALGRLPPALMPAAGPHSAVLATSFTHPMPPSAFAHSGPEVWNDQDPPHSPPHLATQHSHHPSAAGGHAGQLTTKRSLRRMGSNRPVIVPPLEIPSSPDLPPHPHRDSSATPKSATADRNVRDAHLSNLRNATTRVLARAASRRHPQAASGLAPLTPITPAAAVVDSPPNTARSGATERLLQTLKSRKGSTFTADVSGSNRPSLAGTTNRPTSGAATRASVAVRSRASQIGSNNNQNNAVLGTIIEVLGPQAYCPFNSATPRPLHLGLPSVFVEMALLGSGRVFGEAMKGSSSKRRPASAVADTNVELLVLQKADVEARLGDAVSFLWCQEPMEGQVPLVSDDAIRAHLEHSLRWEVFKKGMLKDVLAQKRAKINAICRP